MARTPFLSRLRRRGQPPPQPVREPDERAASDNGDAAPPPRRRPLPPPGRIRRERRALRRQRDERIRDLGGLVLEMYRRDDVRQELIDERCAELTGLDERLYELEELLRAASGGRRPAPAARCACGAPIPWGSRFCATCGRPTAVRPTVVCETCGAALAADAKFCAACGTPVGPATDPEPAADAAEPAEPAEPEEG